MENKIMESLLSYLDYCQSYIRGGRIVTTIQLAPQSRQLKNLKMPNKAKLIGPGKIEAIHRHLLIFQHASDFLIFV
jgi:hypothetical protein